MRKAHIYWDAGVHPVLVRELTSILTRAQKAVPSPLPPIYVMTDCSHARSNRNFAAISSSDYAAFQLYLCADLAHQPITRIRGVLWHEVGHVIAATLGLRTIMIDGTVKLDEEQTADALVGALCNVNIYYDDELVQRAGPGAKGSRPRPRGLK